MIRKSRVNGSTLSNSPSLSDDLDGLVVAAQAHAEAQSIPRQKIEGQLVGTTLIIVLHVSQCLGLRVPRHRYRVALLVRPVVKEAVQGTHSIVPAVSVVTHYVSSVANGSRIEVVGGRLGDLFVAHAQRNPRHELHNSESDGLALHGLLTRLNGRFNEREIGVVVVLLNYEFAAIGDGVTRVLISLAEQVVHPRLGLSIDVDSQYTIELILVLDRLIKFRIFGRNLLQQLLDGNLVVGLYGILLFLRLFVLLEEGVQFLRLDLPLLQAGQHPIKIGDYRP